MQKGVFGRNAAAVSGKQAKVCDNKEFLKPNDGLKLKSALRHNRRAPGRQPLPQNCLTADKIVPPTVGFVNTSRVINRLIDGNPVDQNNRKTD